MKNLERRIEHNSKSDIFNIYFLADSHMLGATFFESLFRKHVRMIADDPFALWAGMGDISEFITYFDRKRFGLSDLAPETLERLDNIGELAFEKTTKLLKPIRGKMLFYIKGNHEDSYDKYYNQKISERICQKLGREDGYGDKMCQFRLTFARKQSDTRQFIINAHHGVSAPRTDGALVNYMNRLPTQFDADIYVRAHAHRMRTWKLRRMGIPRKGKLQTVEHPLMMICCGSYKKSYLNDVVSYLERLDYPASGLGCIVLHIKPYARKFWCEEMDVD